MVTVTIEVKEKYTTRRLRCSAPTIERAIELSGGQEKARVVFPIEPEAFFTREITPAGSVGRRTLQAAQGEAAWERRLEGEPSGHPKGRCPATLAGPCARTTQPQTRKGRRVRNEQEGSAA
ncbi:MAG: hypothetical protein H0U65_05325 [Rubrobacter sp.]|nr:hypothetical protein [Rubrobacter sp.]